MALGQLVDFSGGYVTNRPVEQLRRNEALVATNCFWDNELKKRAGLKQYATLSAGGTLRGGIRAIVNDTWYSFVAEDAGDPSVVRFYSATATTFTEIDSTFTWTTGKKVFFEQLNGNVIAVSEDGSDWPLLIDWDPDAGPAALRIRNLEAADLRVRGDSTWVAGQWDDSAAATDAQFVDDTTDAQDADADDFQIGNTTTNDGCIIACDHTFNKVVFTSAQQAGGSPVAEYAFWNPTDEAWETFTPETAPTWTAAAGDRTVEWDWRTAAGFYGEDHADIVNRFVLRIRFTTAASGAFSCDSITVSHTQYLRQILSNEKPHRLEIHNSRVFMAVGLYTQLGPINRVSGWHQDDQEYFQEGGSQITAMASYGDVLAVFKEKALFHLTGNSYKNWGKDKRWEGMGTTEPLSVAAVKGFLMFLETDGQVALWNGNACAVLSSGIQDELDGFTTTGANAIEYGASRSGDLHYWLALPGSSVLLRADPDTLREDPDTGEWSIAFFKYTSYRVDLMMPHFGDGDNGLLLGLDNGTTKQIIQLERTDVTGTDFAATAITQTFRQLLRMKKDLPAHRRFVKRLKVRLSKSGDWTLKLYADEGDASSATVTLESGTGSTPFQAEVTLPYEMDRHNIAVELVNAQTKDAAVYSISWEQYARAF